MSKRTKPAFFGTDGVRGVANIDPVTPEVALKLGRVAARVMVRDADHAGSANDTWPRCIVGRDTRISGDLLEAAFAAGMASEGVDVQLAGVVPTPAVSFLVRDEGASLGVVISASHNPFADNGIKFFAGDGYKLGDAQERAIEDLVLAEPGAIEDGKRPTGGKVGRISTLPKAADRYIAAATRSVGPDRSGMLDGMRVALDAANGAAFRTSVAVLENLGADLRAAHVQPNGVNINEDCGCTHPSVIAALVKETAAVVGLAHDGDADRIVLCDERGEVLDGDEILAIVGLHLLETGALRDNTLVATIMSNCGLDETLRQHGGRVIRSGVGDREVMREMRAGGYNFGGEQSGHIICRDYNPTGDGIIAGLQVLRVMVESGKRLSELRQCLVKFPQLLVSIPVTCRPPIEELAETAACIAETEAELGAAGRVLLRYSGTEPKIRLLVEGRDQAYVRQRCDLIAAAIRAQIGA